jgi:hypothetical protein
LDNKTSQEMAKEADGASKALLAPALIRDVARQDKRASATRSVVAVRW